MRLRHLQIFVVGFALAAVGCSAIAEAAATVDGHKISDSMLQSEIDFSRDDPLFQARVQQFGEEVGRGDFRRETLSALIAQSVMARQASELGVEVTDSDVDELIDGLRADLGEELFESRLAELGLTLDRARVLARRNLVQERLQQEVTKDLEVDDDQILRAYVENEPSFAEFRLLRITVATEQEAQDILSELDDGARFSSLAQERSIDDAREDGGDLGFVTAEELPEALVLELQQASDDDVLGPVTSRAGQEIYQLLERRTTPLDDVRDRIADQLLAQDRQVRFNEWLTSKLLEADIVVNPKYGVFDEDNLRVVAGPDEIPS